MEINEFSQYNFFLINTERESGGGRDRERRERRERLRERERRKRGRERRERIGWFVGYLVNLLVFFIF